MAWPKTHEDWVRPGLMLYGVTPMKNKTAKGDDLKPVMTLETEVIAKHWVKQGEAIGYNSQFVCPKDMPSGIIAVGYGDGYPQQAPNGVPVWIAGKRVALIGRVAMDMSAIDLSSCPDIDIGERVVLWGDDLPIEDVASAMGSSGYQLLTALGIRVPRVEITKTTESHITESNTLSTS